MDAKQTQAYEWAKNQKYTSVAADYARTLAGAIDAITADRDAWKRRAEAAEKVCSAAHMYVKHINSPLCVGWDMLLDALRKWTDERRGPRDEGKEESK